MVHIEPISSGFCLASTSTMTKVQTVRMISKIKTALKTQGLGKRINHVRKINT